MRKHNPQFKTQIGGEGHSDDRMFVEVDGAYSVAIIRTSEGVRMEVFPITDDKGKLGSKDGEVWSDPIDRFETFDDDVAIALASGKDD